MDEATFDRAAFLMRQMHRIEDRLKDFDENYGNNLDLPAPMFKRHRAEIKAYYKMLLKKAEMEFKEL